jgi:hypothetical protein
MTTEGRTYNDHDMRNAYEEGRRKAGGKLVATLTTIGMLVVVVIALAMFFGIRPATITTGVNDALATAVVRATTPARQNTTTGGSTNSGATTDNGQAAIDAYNATAQAAYQQAVNAAAMPVPNIDTTGDTSPNVRVSVPSERQPAGENVPTAEPLTQPQNTSQHGSKSKPVNIQETKTCLHGQVWIDGRGCKNPTPVK